MVNVVLKAFSVVLRLVLLLVGLVFVASVLAAGVVLLLLWMLRALWARASGKPVRPWAFRLHKQAMWDPFRRGGFVHEGESQGDVVDAVVTEVSDTSARRIETRRAP